MDSEPCGSCKNSTQTIRPITLPDRLYHVGISSKSIAGSSRAIGCASWRIAHGNRLLKRMASRCNGFMRTWQACSNWWKAADWTAEDLEVRLTSQAQRPFDLEQGPLLRSLRLFKRDERESNYVETRRIIADFGLCAFCCVNCPCCFLLCKRVKTCSCQVCRRITAIRYARKNSCCQAHRQRKCCLFGRVN